VFNEWLSKRALVNQITGASRTFLVVDNINRVLGYYALSSGAVSHNLSTGGVRRNMPDPVPVLVLGRLAVDTKMQGARLGAALLQDALLRTSSVAQQIGVRAMLVHALNANACAFYQHYGFQPSPVDAMTLMLKLGSA